MNALGIYFLTTQNGGGLTPQELGAIGCMFLLAAGILKILSFVLRKKYESEENQPCKAYTIGKCPVAEDWKKFIEGLEKLKDDSNKSHDDLKARIEVLSTVFKERFKEDTQVMDKRFQEYLKKKYNDSFGEKKKE